LALTNIQPLPAGMDIVKLTFRVLLMEAAITPERFAAISASLQDGNGLQNTLACFTARLNGLDNQPLIGVCLSDF